MDRKLISVILRSATTMLCGMTFGSGMYIIKVEHKSRSAIKSVDAIVDSFAKMLELGKTYQGFGVLLSTIGGFIVYGFDYGSQHANYFLTGATVQAISFPFTAMCLLPINRQFLDTENVKKKEEKDIRDLHDKWMRFHGFRTFLNGVTFLAYFYSWVQLAMK